MTDTSDRGAALLGALASADVAVLTARNEARERHAIYRTHALYARHCACATGGICRKGQRLLDEADDAGKRADRLARGRSR